MFFEQDAHRAVAYMDYSKNLQKSRHSYNILTDFLYDIFRTYPVLFKGKYLNTWMMWIE